MYDAFLQWAWKVKNFNSVGELIVEVDRIHNQGTKLFFLS